MPGPGLAPEALAVCGPALRSAVMFGNRGVLPKVMTMTASRTMTAALLALLAALTPALAVDHHVRIDGSDSVCSGLINAADPGAGPVPRPCAFRNPQTGADVAHKGDTVFLHAGTYSTQGTIVQGTSAILGFDRRTDLDANNRLTIKAAGDRSEEHKSELQSL